MNLLLFRKTVIVSSLTETEIIGRLSEIIDSEKRSFFSNPDRAKKYTGKIENRAFKIHKIVKGRNSFIPIIKGEIIDISSTRKIELTMRLHFIVILFLFWISGLVIYSLINLNNSSGLFFMVVVLGMTIFFFNQECNKAVKDLEYIFSN